MLESFNFWLFRIINATPKSPEWIVKFAIFISKDAVDTIMLLIVNFWTWRLQKNGLITLRLVIKSIMSVFFGLFFSWIIGIIFPHDRPFVYHVGYSFLKHKADNSFPSDHSIVAFTLAISFCLFWNNIWSSGILFIFAIAISWSRIYLGIHWPLDIAGSFLVAIFSCLIVKSIWNFYKPKLQFL